MITDCTNCPGCNYGACRGAEPRVPTKTHIYEEHIYRWECPGCGRKNTAYCKETPKAINCIQCGAELPTPGPSQEGNCNVASQERNKYFSAPFALSAVKDDFDLEKANFIAWYRDATVEEFAVACKNNADKLNALVKKYAMEIKLMDIFLPRRYENDGKL